jgi:ribonuclease HII
VFNFADSISLSVAAASILAKVTRDRLLIDLDAHYPAYQFARHKGYGTQIHRAALQSVGPCAIHRTSFKPISALLANRLI